jgi:putative FmdB family regulatory protein
MRVYGYRCQDCGHTYWQMREIADRDVIGKCSRCENKAVVRLKQGTTVSLEFRKGPYIGDLQIHACNTGVVANGAHLTIGTLRATATNTVFDFTNGGSVTLGNAVHDVSPDRPAPIVEGKSRKRRKRRDT